jgi:thiol-disulfide isomerase/thioredoxin
VGVSSSSVLNFGGGTFSRVKDTMAPSFQLVDLRQPRRTISLEKFHGHFLIVNFWASWCPPCRKEMPALARAAHQLGDKVDFVGLDYLDERDAALAFAKNTKVRYPLAFVSAQVWASYGGYGLPTTFFVSPDGHILGRQVGGLTKARLLSLVHQVFNVAVTTKSDT